MKIAITGKQHVGKTAIACILEKTHGWSVSRWRDDSTPENMSEADAIIVRPEDIDAMCKAMPGTQFQVLYVLADDESVREELCMKGSHEPQKALMELQADDMARKDAFDLIERAVSEQLELAPNCPYTTAFRNTYEQSDMEQLAIQLEFTRRFIRNANAIMDDLADAGVLNRDADGSVIVMLRDAPQPVHPDRLAQRMLYDDTPMLGSMVAKWLQLPGTDLAKGRNGHAGT